MLTIEEVDTDNRAQVKRFVELPYRLYRDCPQWVPPLYVEDMYRPETFGIDAGGEMLEVVDAAQ